MYGICVRSNMVVNSARHHFYAIVCNSMYPVVLTKRDLSLVWWEE